MPLLLVKQNPPHFICVDSDFEVVKILLPTARFSVLFVVLLLLKNATNFRGPFVGESPFDCPSFFV
jgi:hypothetical protein